MSLAGLTRGENRLMGTPGEGGILGFRERAELSNFVRLKKPSRSGYSQSLDESSPRKSRISKWGQAMANHLYVSLTKNTMSRSPHRLAVTCIACDLNSKTTTIKKAT